MPAGALASSPAPPPVCGEVWGATVGAAYTSASISGTWGLYEDLTPNLSELSSYWSIGDEYTVVMTATSTCSSSQNLGFEGGGVGYFQVTVPANAVNVRVSATDTVGVDPTTGTHTSYGFQSRSTNSASCTITVADLSASTWPSPPRAYPRRRLPLFGRTLIYTSRMGARLISGVVMVCTMPSTLALIWR